MCRHRIAQSGAREAAGKGDQKCRVIRGCQPLALLPRQTCCQRTSRTLATSSSSDQASPFHHVPPQPERIRQQTRRFHPLLSSRSTRLRTLSARHRRRGIHQHHNEPYRCCLSCTSPCCVVGVLCIDRRRRITSFARPWTAFSIIWTGNTGNAFVVEYDVFFCWRRWRRDSVAAEYQYRYRGQLASQSSDIALECVDAAYIAGIQWRTVDGCD
jgi:hypothetical protein